MGQGYGENFEGELAAWLCSVSSLGYHRTSMITPNASVMRSSKSLVIYLKTPSWKNAIQSMQQYYHNILRHASCKVDS